MLYIRRQSCIHRSFTIIQFFQKTVLLWLKILHKTFTLTSVHQKSDFTFLDLLLTSPTNANNIHIYLAAHLG